VNNRCRSCDAPITWAVTRKGRRIPLDPEPVAGGNIKVQEIPGKSTPLATVMGSGCSRRGLATSRTSHHVRSHIAIGRSE
jgi:hypothetical protein